MKKFKLWLPAVITAFLVSCSHNDKVSSPDGAVTAQIVQENEKLSLKISLHGSEVAHWQIDGVALGHDEYDFTGKLTQKDVSFAKIDEEYTLPTGKVSVYQNKANEMTVGFANASGKTMNLLVRAYNDGVAFRYAFENSNAMPVNEERTTLVIPEESNVWAMEYKMDSEGYYLKRSPSEMTNPLYILPVLVETNNGDWLLVHEADVLGRSAASSLSNHQGEGRFSLTTTYPELEQGGLLSNELWAQVVAEDGNAIHATPNWATPWRMLIVGDTLATIVESVMTENLNPPSIINDQSWIKAGVSVYPWWGNNFANGINEFLINYIDMAKRMGWGILEFDISRIGSPNYAQDYWLNTPWINDVTEYARKNDILVYGMDERRNLNTPEKRKFIYEKYKEFGVVGIKIDYINSFAQKACDFRKDCLTDAANHQLMVSFHSDYTPRGERRTYPNLMTQEGVKGSEYYILSKNNDIPTPRHNATIPFTRNVIGPMDYTPTAFSTDRRTTTYAHETALPFVFESGWVVMCDKPNNYLFSSGINILQQIEAFWDEIKFIAGYPGEYTVIARRKGEKWVIAGINSGPSRKVTIEMDFLSDQISQVLLCMDDKNDPQNRCVMFYYPVNNQKLLSIEMSENGGFVAII
ncbi:MAG: glycoside hydrolase family 97 protein [Tannerella sp.]|jgi:alpha-glucosidase|nr:glycoside hydrolase family 97 protein [Tannerella sp.]